jgi:hypothetical protein
MRFILFRCLVKGMVGKGMVGEDEARANVARAPVASARRDVKRGQWRQ